MEDELYAIYRRLPQRSAETGHAEFDSFGREGEEHPVARFVVESLSETQAAELAASREYEIAPAMTMGLFDPAVCRNTDDGDFWGVEAIGAASTDCTGRDVTVAILDTGVDADHPAFERASIEQVDFTGSTEPGDPNGHGTHTAGIFIGGEVDGRRVGVAPGVSRTLSARVLDAHGKGMTTNILRGLRWAMESGANVISLSLGLDYAGEVARRMARGWPEALAASRGLQSYRENVALFDVFMSEVRAKGLTQTDPLIVAASGNDSRRELRPDYTMGCVVPASVANVAVGAVGRSGDAFEAATFSNGPPLLVAPGVDVASAWPGASSRTMSGTSAACPHAAGCAALWWEWLRSETGLATGDTVRSHLVSSADRKRFDVLVDRVLHGSGMVSAPG